MAELMAELARRVPSRIRCMSIMLRGRHARCRASVA